MGVVGKDADQCVCSGEDEDERNAHKTSQEMRKFEEKSEAYVEKNEGCMYEVESLNFSARTWQKDEGGGRGTKKRH
jgi:hypothetical protein